MQLEGSCHCGRVQFSVWAHSPVPFMRCYCSICRKTAGSGGFAINLGADASTLKVVKGKRELRIYQARLPDDSAPGGERESSAQRHFCGRCGSPLWLYDPRWPELVHPHAGAIDTPLPVPPAHVHLMLGSKANWVEAEGRTGDERFNAYPSMSLAEWHEQHGLASPRKDAQS
ncbi:GFA family protein [Aquincola sp. S2]|uniref:GFA family protein n=1 Tax=Pseudaquabacterium terrae TaxID=2732868 RepID=A0ABX2EEH2_9BURK|nr:GFA family protein [Aquabacterium terrae]NRF67012.1 GFA family protein [Aquabacterium terrae]